MNDVERMTAVAQELMVSIERLDGLVAAAEDAGFRLTPAEIIAAVSRDAGFLLNEARYLTEREAARSEHPSRSEGLRRWRFGR